MDTVQAILLPDTPIQVYTREKGILNTLESTDLEFVYQKWISDTDTIVFIRGKESQKIIAMRMDANVEPIDLCVEDAHIDSFESNALINQQMSCD